MVNIYELDEQQLREYASSQSQEAEEGYALNDAIEKFEYIESLYQKKRGMFSKIEALLKEKALDDVYDKCYDLAASIDRLSTRIKTFPFEIGEKSSNKKIRLDKLTDERKKLIFSREEGYLKITLPEMLPHKQQYDSRSQKMKYYYDIDSWKATYYNQFLKEFENGKYRIFSEKVSICYIMHISPSKKRGVADADNYDTKVMTDIITTFLLPDDNFLCCNYMVDIVIDEKCIDIDDCYTDIIICPSEIREQVLKNL